MAGASSCDRVALTAPFNRERVSVRRRSIALSIAIDCLDQTRKNEVSDVDPIYQALKRRGARAVGVTADARGRRPMLIEAVGETAGARSRYAWFESTDERRIATPNPGGRETEPEIETEIESE